MIWSHLFADAYNNNSNNTDRPHLRADANNNSNTNKKMKL